MNEGNNMVLTPILITEKGRRYVELLNAGHNPENLTEEEIDALRELVESLEINPQQPWET